MSANAGLQWREDVTRRAGCIRLAYFEEDGNSRVFTYPDLHGFVRQNRELLLSSVYSLVTDWKRQGCAPGPVYTSFPQVGEVVGGVLQAHGLGNPCWPTNWGGMDVGGDPVAEAMRAVFVAGHERHGNDWLDHNTVRALVEGPDSVSDHWNELKDSKDKEFFTRDLKIYNRRTLNDITLFFKDPTKKLNKTKLQFRRDLSRENTGTLSKKVPEYPRGTRLQVGGTSEDKEKKINNIGRSDSTATLNPVPSGASGTFLHSAPYEYVTDNLAFGVVINVLGNEPRDSPLCLDIETYGPPVKTKNKIKDPLGPAALDPLRGSIRLLSLKSENSPVYIIDLDRICFPPELKEVLESRTLVGHNLWFDLAFLKWQYQIKAGNLFDTMAAAKILTNGLPDGAISNSLGPAIFRYLGIDIVKDQGTSDWSASDLSEDQLHYAATDVHHLLALKGELERLLECADLTYTAKIENALLPS